MTSEYSNLTNGAIQWNPPGKLNFKRLHLFQLSYGLPRFDELWFLPLPRRSAVPPRRQVASLIGTNKYADSICSHVVRKHRWTNSGRTRGVGTRASHGSAAKAPDKAPCAEHAGPRAANLLQR